MQILGSKALEPHYEGWFRQLITDYRNSEPAARYSSEDEYLRHNGFFVTSTFHRWGMLDRKRKLSLRPSDVSLEMDAFHRFYCAIAKATIGNHWENKNNRFPFALVSIDHGEAKYAVTTSGKMTNLHWHAMMICRSDDQHAYAAALNNSKFLNAFKEQTLADKVEVSAWDSSKRASYITKAHVKAAQAATAGTEEILIYPKPSVQGRLGWGYRNSYRHVVRPLKRLIGGMKRLQAAELDYSSRYGNEP
ncbi:MAG TPA: hypothetical protein VIL30_11490 [Ramlibacter sp.]